MSEPEKVTAGEALPLRLRWRQTQPNSEADYIAETDTYNGPVGRIFRHDSSPDKGAWLWAMQADSYEVSRNVGELHGVERSARAAAHMVEDAWFQAIRGSSLEKAGAEAQRLCNGEVGRIDWQCSPSTIMPERHSADTIRRIAHIDICDV